MLGSARGADGVDAIERLAKAGITLNCQIVCCPGINDGAELEFSMTRLARLYPGVNSVSIVPVGLTRHRSGLYPLTPYDKARAGEVIGAVEAYAQKCLKACGSRVFFCADEFYIKAGRSLPEDEEYEGYVQLENGVGMMRLLITEFTDELEHERPASGEEFTLITGEDAAPFLQKLLCTLRQKWCTINGTVRPVKNAFFGESVTVAGLVTGGDIMRELERDEPRGRLLLPRNMLRHGEKVFLDDMRLSDIEARFGKVRIVEQDGADLLRAMLGK
jgi:NifB/MoaA-like Fe-S oxidoreductase